MQITTEVKSDVIANMMISAIESGDPVTTAARGGWCSGINVSEELEHEFAFYERPQSKSKYPWYANPKFYESSKAVIEIIEVDDETTGHETTHKITPADMQRGIALMAKVCPEHFAYIVNDDTDAPCADSFLQCTVFGELKYG